MPKAKPDRVEVLRIELQEKEREILESYLLTWQASKAASGIDQLLSLENAYLAVTLYEIFSGKEIMPGTPNDIYQLIEWVNNYVKENRDNLYDEAGTTRNVFLSILQQSTVVGQAGGVDWLDQFRQGSDDS
mgnify:CR=1 FL=1